MARVFFFFPPSVQTPCHSVVHKHSCGLTDAIKQKAQRKSNVTGSRFHCHLIGADDGGPHTPRCPHTCHRLQDLTRHPAEDYKEFNTLKGLRNVGSFSPMSSHSSFPFLVFCCLWKDTLCILSLTRTHLQFREQKREVKPV